MTVKLPVSLIADEIELMCKLCIFPSDKVTQLERAMMMEHVRQLRQHTGDVWVNSQFEARGDMIRLRIEISPRELRPWKRQ